jgi:hypothetical protein
MQNDNRRTRHKLKLITLGLFLLAGIFVLVFLIGLIAILLLVTIFYASLKFKHNTTSFAVSYSVCLLLALSYSLSIINSKKIKLGAHSGVEFSVDGKIIRSDANNYFVGKTDKYIFFFKSKEKRCIVFPISKLDFVSFPEIDEGTPVGVLKENLGWQ